jgi:predicted Zn finger-like uncharacterized protein
MADTKFTRCPGCKTVFRVTPQQLALRGGQVRCGHCRAVFDANAQAISLAPSARRDFDDDDLARGPATVTLRSSHALEAAVVDAPRAAAAVREPGFAAPTAREPGFTPPAARAPAIEQAPTREAEHARAEPGAAKVDSSQDDARSGRRRQRVRTALYVAAIPVLVVALAVQALVHFRDTIAARWPGAKPLLTRLCDPLGCTIRPLRDIAGLSIDASDLQADPAHKGLLILTATLRNRAAIAVAYPYLELTLTDAGDRVVVRRALTPVEYASGGVSFATGFPANSELLVKTFIDASATTQAGYRLYLYYP